MFLQHCAFVSQLTVSSRWRCCSTNELQPGSDHCCCSGWWDQCSFNPSYQNKTSWYRCEVCVCSCCQVVLTARWARHANRLCTLFHLLNHTQCNLLIYLPCECVLPLCGNVRAVVESNLLYLLKTKVLIFYPVLLLNFNPYANIVLF